MANWLVITGGSHGIGEKTIALFMQQGWQVLNISRTNCTLPKVINVNIDLAQEDISQTDQEKLLTLTKDAEKICLVHNAAAFRTDSITTLSAHDLRLVLNVNVVFPVVLNRVFFSNMQAGSSIIYIGSTLSEQAVPNRASYVISKHALIGLMRSTCQDLAGLNIHTCCICPGFVNTKMLTENVDMNSFKEFIKAKVIAQRLIEPEEIAEFIYFSAMHPMVNGAVFHANLGQVAT